jgi:hypothetical protein
MQLDALKLFNLPKHNQCFQKPAAITNSEKKKNIFRKLVIKKTG